MIINRMVNSRDNQQLLGKGMIMIATIEASLIRRKVSSTPHQLFFSTPSEKASVSKSLKRNYLASS